MKTTIDPQCLAEMGEVFASGFFEMPEAPPVARMARALRRHLEQAPPPEWEGQPLYPSGAWSLWAKNAAVFFHYSHSMGYNRERLETLKAQYPDPGSRAALDALDRYMTPYFKVGSRIPPAYRLGGSGYTHSIPHFGRVAREGLSAYATRVAAGLANAGELADPSRTAFYEAMQDVLAGIAAFHSRCLSKLKKTEGCLLKLIAALERVPFQPARTFYEAVVSANFIYYLDGCDSLGRVDQDLGPFYDRDRREGRMDHPQAVHLIRQLWENVDANSGWNVALGGSRPDGSPAYNALTRICLQAGACMRRPNLALRVRRDMPEAVWDDALDAIASGCGLPALYNEEAYLQALREAGLNLKEEDLADFAFGGCTETMVHGKSNVGSLDAGLNLPEILANTLESRLIPAREFQDVMQSFRVDVRNAIAELAEGVNRDQEQKARYQPQPLRSLLIDDCLETAREFNAGGARYNWSVINVGGLGNVVDSLAAVRELVFEKREITGMELLAALREDFFGRDALRKRISACPRYGNNDARADDLAVDISGFVFEEFQRHTPWRGGRFLPGCLMFVTYAGAGAKVMATPDGRRAGAPIADSAGPVQGRDRAGPTAMIHSVTRINHQLAPGTLVVNARFSPDMFKTPGQREKMKGLIRTYFQLGGMQIQINVVDQAVLEDALEHPELHEDLIVRIGGYSEYFNRLSDALKRSVLERTQHGT